MRLTELAVKRPIMMSMVFILFIFLGLISFPRIGVDLYPPVNIPYISISAVYSGAGPEEIETQLIKPIEDAISGLNNIKTISSTASEGLGVIILEFSMKADLDTAAVDVQKNIDSIRWKLPRDAENPTVKKVDFNGEPVMILALAGDAPLEEVYAIAKDQIKDRLQRLPGVAQVTLIGGKEREIKVAVDQNRLKSYNLTIGQVIARLAATNLTVPAGRIDQDKNEYLVRVQGEFADLEAIKNLNLPLPGGGQANLREIAAVSYGFKDIRSYGRYNGQDAVAISIQKQSNASLVSTADAVNRELAQLQKILPPNVKLTVARDNSTFVHQTLNDTWKNLIEGVLTTGLVLFLFLREWRSTLIVLLAIPASLISTLTIMHFAGYSFNLLTLLGLTMCIGVLVDDTIVVLENIHRHRTELGKDAANAALDGREEIGMAAVAITFSDVVVFGPIAFMTGTVGQFFRQFGLTVVFAVLFSLLVSFTLTPMLASLLFKNRELRPETIKAGPFRKWAGRWTDFQNQILQRYETWLARAFRHRRQVVIICLAAPMLAFSLLPLNLVKTEFMPRYDQNQLTISLEMPPGTSLAATDAALNQLEKRALALPEVESAFATVGHSGQQYMGTANAQTGNIYIRLVDKSQRSLAQWDIAAAMRSWGDSMPGAKVSVFEPSGVHPQMSPIMINISGPNQDQLIPLAEQVKKIVASTPGATDVDSSWRIGQPEIQAEINQLSADYYGLTVDEIAGTVRAAVAGEIATRFRQAGQETDIRVLIKEANHAGLQELKDLGIINHQGQIIPLEQVANLKTEAGPSEIRRLNKQRSVTITANLTDRPLGEVMTDIRRTVDQTLICPPGFEIVYEGEARDMEESFTELLRALIISIVFVYAILVMLYESYLVPVIRMLSLPLGMVGALLALAVTGQTLNILSFIGLIMLDGLVAKNSTLLIDYTHTIMAREGLPLRQALMKAGTTRLRPIIMTTVTMIAGMLPTALAVSAGSEIRSGMAIALIGGLLFSTALTLVAIPVAYTLLDDLKAKLKMTPDSASHKC